MKPDIFEMRAIVKGRVQGVGFRATVRRYAIQLDLKGFARNLQNGSVEICVQGSKNDLELLMKQLKSDNGLIKIESTEVRFGEIEEAYTDFSIM